MIECKFKELMICDDTCKASGLYTSEGLRPDRNICIFSYNLSQSLVLSSQLKLS